MTRNPSRYRFTLVVECDRSEFSAVEYLLTQGAMTEIEDQCGSRHVEMEIRTERPEETP